MIQKTCSQNYTKNQNNAGWQLNAIPVRTVRLPDSLGVYRDYYELYFPRPWLLMGLVTLDPSSVASPTYSNSLVTPESPVQQSAYQRMFLNVFLDLAFATTHELGTGFAVNYVEPGIQSVDYRGKFSRWLNNDALMTPEQMYNSIIQPESLVRLFLAQNVGTASDVWQQRFNELVDYLKTTIDQEIMGAPGLYRYSMSGGASPSFDSQTSYETFIEA